MASGRKIGVLTFHRSINYGSYWQARCLVEGLRARGFDAELLDHDCACIRRAELHCALQPELPQRTPRHLLKSYAVKVRSFARAVATLPLSRRFSLHDPNGMDQYDTVLVGSDEVWNFRHPWYGSQPIFFGDRLNAERLISYAASFGNHGAGDGIDPDWAGKLGAFSDLSVRDENSRLLVRDGLGREPALVLDPCLQFPSFARVGTTSDSRYAVIYGHSFPGWFKRAARRWATKRDVRLLALGYRNGWADEQRITAGPAEFVEAIAGAQAVVTNFFHGCVFALLHGKPWASCTSDYRAIKIPDLMTALGTEHRLIREADSEDTVDYLLDTPVQPSITRNIEEMRAVSNAYLHAALS